jgi:hypothetical protein
MHRTRLERVEHVWEHVEHVWECVARVQERSGTRRTRSQGVGPSCDIEPGAIGFEPEPVGAGAGAAYGRTEPPGAVSGAAKFARTHTEPNRGQSNCADDYTHQRRMVNIDSMAETAGAGNLGGMVIVDNKIWCV